MESQPEEFRSGLEDDDLEALLSAGDDWDEWQLEGLVGEVAFAAEERLAASEPEPAEDAGQSLLSAFISQGEEETWGIDEPLTAADFAFLDEDDWPEP